MIVLDTNVISEMMKANPDRRVQVWLADQPVAGLFIATVTEAELRYGVASLPQGRRRDQLAAALDSMLTEDFADRILPFDSAGAIAYAEITADRRRTGRPISQFDAQIAAIAKSRSADVATRNVSDFEGCGIDIIDPWNT